MIRSDKILAFSAFLIPFAIYLATLANTVSFFDSGELIAGAATLGIPHPPGYPLYAMTGHIFSYIPIGNMAFRINLCSALFGALAVFVVYFIAVKLLGALFTDNGHRIRLTAFSTALIFALSLNQWGQTNMSEVYALNTFLTATLILILIVWRERILRLDNARENNHARLLYLFSFLFGLAFGDHHTILVMAPIFLFVLMVTRWRILIDIKTISLLAFFFILGFSVYLYLPVRASTGLIMNWGDPDTFGQFRWMFMREGYPGDQAARNLALFLEQLTTINLLHEFTVFGFILGIFGILRFCVKGWFFASITALVLLVLSVGVVIYGNPSRENVFLLEAFHTPTYMVFALWIGVALFWLLSFLTAAITKISDDIKMRNLITVLWAGGLILMPNLLFYSHYMKNNRNNNFIAFDYAVNELKSLSSNAILFTWGDSGAFPLWYLQFVEGYRPDVLLLHTPHLSADWYVDEIPALKMSKIRTIPASSRAPGMVVEIITGENYGVRKSYIDYSSKYSFATGNAVFAPNGIVYEHTTIRKPLDTSIWDRYVTRDILSNRILRDMDISKAISIYGFCRYDSGVALLQEGRRSEAIREFVEAVKITPGLKSRIQRLLAPAASGPAS